MSNSEAAEYRRRTDEAIDRLSQEQDPDARDHWKRLALGYARLVDLIAMREGLGLKLMGDPKSVPLDPGMPDLDEPEAAADDRHPTLSEP
jgi:hypothetical protein